MKVKFELRRTKPCSTIDTTVLDFKIMLRNLSFWQIKVEDTHYKVHAYIYSVNGRLRNYRENVPYKQWKRTGNCEVVTNGIGRPRSRKTGDMRAMKWERKRHENHKMSKSRKWRQWIGNESVVTPMKWEEMGRKSMKWEQECHEDEEARWNG
jgi:hypothetical protein